MIKTQSFRHLDLFSGIGGFALAASWVWGDQHEVVSFCEIEPFCQKVLKKHWPDVPIHNDIKTMKGDQYGRIDLVSGGFPCQGFSTCGKEKGIKDSRFLWPEMLRIISQARPAWVIIENVNGLVRLGLDLVQHGLESEGYASRPIMVPACAKGTKHRRDRLWIVANSLRSVHGTQSECKCEKMGARQDPLVYGKERKLARWVRPSGHIVETVGRTTDGISPGLDRSLKALGNAIVPQVVAPIMECIKLITESD